MHKPNYYFIMKLRLFLIAIVAIFVLTGCSQDIEKLGEGTIETEKGLTYVEIDSTRYVGDGFYVPTCEGYKGAELEDGVKVSVFKYSEGDVVFYKGDVEKNDIHSKMSITSRFIVATSLGVILALLVIYFVVIVYVRLD